MSKSINILDKDYIQWIKELSSRYRRSQIKAAVKVNEEMLRFYWELGRDIVERDVENKYGSGFYEMLSKDLKDAIPMTTGFSNRNLRYAKKFYSIYNEELVKLQQVAAKTDEQNLQQVAARIMSDIFSVPWGHHMLVIDKCKGDSQSARKGATIPPLACSSARIKTASKPNMPWNRAASLWGYRSTSWKSSIPKK